MAKITKAEIQKEAEFLKSYAKGKPINNYGGNFWGFNRNRCSIIKPETITALVDSGYAEMLGTGSFRMKDSAPKAMKKDALSTLSAAETSGGVALAKSMSISDLEWQIKNAAKLGTQAMNHIFKAELATRK